jgi:hypothetical protein
MFMIYHIPDCRNLLGIAFRRKYKYIFSIAVLLMLMYRILTFHAHPY